MELEGALSLKGCRLQSSELGGLRIQGGQGVGRERS